MVKSVDEATRRSAAVVAIGGATEFSRPDEVREISQGSKEKKSCDRGSVALMVTISGATEFGRHEGCPMTRRSFTIKCIIFVSNY